jgi:hypothetical protein
VLAEELREPRVAQARGAVGGGVAREEGEGDRRNGGPNGTRSNLQNSSPRFHCALIACPGTTSPGASVPAGAVPAFGDGATSTMRRTTRRRR